MYVTIAYDIRDDRRRDQVAKLLEDHGTRVQYSVFDCFLDERELQRLRRRLEAVVLPEEDSVRFYRLCQRCCAAIEVLGQGRVLDDDQFRIV
jgi:CRISPR-associated protein Cas2